MTAPGCCCILSEHLGLARSPLTSNGFHPRLDLERYQNVGCGISVRTMPISHGHNETVGTYESAAFFVRHDASLAEFLFFGDVEPDSVSLNPRNAAVWAVAAEKIAQGVLNTIFIECSWPSGRPDAQLYGHLTPDHLVVELGVLAAEVVRCRQEKSKETAPASDKRSSSRPARKRRRTNASTDGKLRTSLRDVRVYVIHCKDDLEERYDQPIAHIITNQIKDQVEEKGLGVTVIAAEQGMHISQSYVYALNLLVSTYIFLDSFLNKTVTCYHLGTLSRRVHPVVAIVTFVAVAFRF